MTAMTNVWVICRKELRSYFASPIAYAVMALFALIFGIWFYLFTREFVNFSFRSQMSGGGSPMSVNEYIIRPILGFAGTISLFLIPLIRDRKSTRLNSSHRCISYAVFCFKNKT